MHGEDAHDMPSDHRDVREFGQSFSPSETLPAAAVSIYSAWIWYRSPVIHVDDHINDHPHLSLTIFSQHMTSSHESATIDHEHISKMLENHV